MLVFYLRNMKSIQPLIDHFQKYLPLKDEEKDMISSSSISGLSS